ncbi:flagellar basal body-associated FliL family protein [Marinobacter sp. S0848L]|uniref:flagellar basal body-associated FliL family protein n=1 Tax=Marinobacter sp. S0848L TaxID=2926423 RepID=UPI001FF4BF1F|nr:flagellar basal body-associated FliL family protein [Marinobacter sp. S0848L]MCK0107138.1 flagellar basal body-associated FliL family protein [Marinobacter sp. S0848L]
MAENTTAQEPEKKGKLKIIITVVVITLLAIGLSVAGTLWFLKGDAASTAEESSTEPAEPEFQASVYSDIQKPLRTTVQAQGRQRYAQIYLSFEAKDPAALEGAKKHMPLILNQLNMLLGSTQFSDLQAPEGRVALSEKMLEAVNKMLEQEGEPAIARVLFRNFVVQ